MGYHFEQGMQYEPLDAGGEGQATEGETSFAGGASETIMSIGGSRTATETPATTPEQNLEPSTPEENLQEEDPVTGTPGYEEAFDLVRTISEHLRVTGDQ